MSFDRTLGAPIQGVTTIPDNRAPVGFMREQVNFRCDLREGLMRRPQLRWLTNLDQFYTAGVYTLLEYRYDSKNIIIQVFEGAPGTSHVRRWEDGTYIGDTSLSKQYTDYANLKVVGIYDNVYIWEESEYIQTTSTQDPFWGSQAMLNITGALNYAEEVTVVLNVNGTDAETITYTVPGLTGSNQDVADRERATNFVANAIRTEINTRPTNVRADVEGSNISMFQFTTTPVIELQVRVSSGRGDGSILAFNKTIQDPAGLPKYAIDRTILKVQPDPRSNQGAYYLKAEYVAPGVSSMREVVWVETQDPENQVAYDRSTLPTVYNMTDNTWAVWDLLDRAVGDESSNEAPWFIGRPISNMTLFQDRLGLLTNDKIVFSETDDYENFYLNSATELLVTDPTTVGATGSTTQLKQVVFHNKSLLAFGEDAQFKINGAEALTPQSAAMALTAANECYTAVPPVQMNSNVYYASIEGDSTGIYRYEVQADTVVDVASSVTEHVVGYISGVPVRMAGNANSIMLLVQTDASDNTLWVYEQISTEDEENNSWSKWVFDERFSILSFSVNNDRASVTAQSPDGTVHLYQVDLRNAELEQRDIVRLDGAAHLTNTGVNQWALPTGYHISAKADDVKVIVVDAAELSLNEVDYSIANGIVTVEEDIDQSAGLVIGIPYRSSFIPKRIYNRHPDGTVREQDALRMREYILGVSNSYELNSTITTVYGDSTEFQQDTKTSSFEQGFLDEWHPLTGEWIFPVCMRTDEYDIEFYTDSHFPCAVSYISYMANTFSTRTRR